MAQETILDAAMDILLAEGLDAVRVQRVAARVGVTDAAVHYHFGNHQGLVAALLRHSARKLVAEITDAGAVPGGSVNLWAISRALKRTYVDRNAARLLVWLRFAGFRPRGAGMFENLVEALHALRVANAKARQVRPPGLSDTKFLVALLNAAHFAQALLGEPLLRAVDADASEDGQQRFLDWVTELVLQRVG